jgi:hypothetical protein
LGVVDAGTIENDTGYLSGLVKDVAKVHDIPPEVFLGETKGLINLPNTTGKGCQSFRYRRGVVRGRSQAREFAEGGRGLKSGEGYDRFKLKIKIHKKKEVGKWEKL